MSNCKSSFYLLIILNILFVDSVFSKPYVIKDEFRIINSIDSSYLYVLEDKQKKYEIDLILENNHLFKKVDNFILDSRSAYWIKFELKNSSNLGKTVRISPGFMWMEGDIYFNKENELIRNNIQGRLGTYNNTSKTDTKNTLDNDYKRQISTLHLDSNETVNVLLLNSDRIFTLAI